MFPEQENTPVPMQSEVAKFVTLFLESKIIWIPLVVIILLGGGGYFFLKQTALPRLIVKENVTASSAYKTVVAITGDQQILKINSDGSRTTVTQSVRETLPEIGTYSLSLLPQPQKGNVVFFSTYKDGTDAPRGPFYSFDTFSKTFKKLNNAYQAYTGWGELYISPNGLYGLSATNQSLSLVDFTNDSITPLKPLSSNETFNVHGEGFGDSIGTEIKWLSDQSIQFVVKDTNSAATRMEELLLPFSVKDATAQLRPLSGKYETTSVERQVLAGVTVENETKILVGDMRTLVPNLKGFSVLSYWNNKAFLQGYADSYVFYSYDIPTNSLVPLQAPLRHYDPHDNPPITSPSGRYYIYYSHNNAELSDSSDIYLIDLAEDTEKLVKHFQAGETLFAPNYSVYELKWADNNTIQFTVYKISTEKPYMDWVELRKETLSI